MARHFSEHASQAVSRGSVAALISLEKRAKLAQPLSQNAPKPARNYVGADSAIGCASMLLAARGMATPSIQMEVRCTLVNGVVLFIAGIPREFTPHLPSAQSMHGQIIRFRPIFALRVAHEAKVDPCPIRAGLPAPRPFPPLPPLPPPPGR